MNEIFVFRVSICSTFSDFLFYSDCNISMMIITIMMNSLQQQQLLLVVQLFLRMLVLLWVS